MRRPTDIRQFTLRNDYGMTVTVTNFGATIMSIKVPDRDGQIREVTLGFDTLDEYVRQRTYMGPIAGRVANRIAKGTFSLDGKTYHLNCNNGPNHLHGGPEGWAKLAWEVADADDRQVQFKLFSPDGDEGYPGNIHAFVSYAVSDNNTLGIFIDATTDVTTLINPTSHCYFNFNTDHSQTIFNHILQIHAEHYTPSDAGLIPTGEIAPVAGTPMDFRTPKLVGKDIHADFDQLKNAGGYDHNWALDEYHGLVRKSATLHCPETGILMETWTDQPGVQCYTGNSLGKYIGRNGLQYPAYSGICLETQGFPDAINHPNFPSVIVEPGAHYGHETRYMFGIL